MGLGCADIELSNPRDLSLNPMPAKALVDTGAVTICIPEHMALQLKLDELEKREITTADGKNLLVPYVGPLQIRFGNRNCFTGALVLGDSALLRGIPMEDIDLIINPRSQKVSVNLQSPNIPSVMVKKTVARRNIKTI